MALETELRNRVEQSVKELEQVVKSLHEVKRLADSNQTSAEQLARLTTAMDLGGEQMRALLDSLGQAGATLIAGANMLKGADPGPAIAEMKTVVSELKSESVALRQSFVSVDRQLESLTKMLQGVTDAISGTQRQMAESTSKLESMIKETTSGNAKTGKELGKLIDEAAVKVDVLAKRIRPLIIAVWLAVVFSGIGASLLIAARFH